MNYSSSYESIMLEICMYNVYMNHFHGSSENISTQRRYSFQRSLLVFYQGGVLTYYACCDTKTLLRSHQKDRPFKSFLPQ
jgi:hypothetical protein